MGLERIEMLCDPRVCQGRSPHPGKGQVEIMLKQMLDQATVDCRLQVFAATSGPFHSEIANDLGMSGNEFADAHDRLPAGVFLARWRWPARQNGFGVGDCSSQGRN
jgi:hypothetical protein